MSKYTSLQQTTKFLTSFQRFQTEVNVLRLNKTKIITGSNFNQGQPGVKGNFEPDNKKKTCFGYFCRLVTHAL